MIESAFLHHNVVELVEVEVLVRLRVVDDVSIMHHFC